MLGKCFFPSVPLWVRLYDMTFNGLVEKKVKPIVGLIGEVQSILVNDKNVVYAQVCVIVLLDNPPLSGW